METVTRTIHQEFASGTLEVKVSQQCMCGGCCIDEYIVPYLSSLSYNRIIPETNQCFGLRNKEAKMGEGRYQQTFNLPERKSFEVTATLSVPGASPSKLSELLKRLEILPDLMPSSLISDLLDKLSMMASFARSPFRSPYESPFGSPFGYPFGHM